MQYAETAVYLDMVIWYIMSYSLVAFYRHFRRVLVVIYRIEDFHLENEGSTFLQNIGTCLPNDSAVS
jgi:hypothetical protein